MVCFSLKLIQIREFCTKFASTAPIIEDVIPVLLRLKTFSSTISSTDLAPHVHTEMNNMLNFLLAKKNFDFFKLGSELRSAGPLGRDIVVSADPPQNLFFAPNLAFASFSENGRLFNSL
jgi:hypothetical protein